MTIEIATHSGRAREALPGVDDITAPTVQDQPPGETAPAGEPSAVSAAVIDDIGVAEVKLFYHPQGNSEYTEILMQRILDSDVCLAVSPGEDVQEPGVEHYIQAVNEPVMPCSVATLSRHW